MVCESPSRRAGKGRGSFDRRERSVCEQLDARVSDLQLSEQGRNLIYVVIGGLVIGAALYFVPLGGVPLTDFLIQYNEAVLTGRVWQLVTSIIVVFPYYPGIVDVAFNAMALAWLDGILSYTYTKSQYYAVFLVTGIAGNIFSLANGPNVSSFGASGGIFGLLAGVISFDLVTNRRVNPGLMVWFALIFIVSSFTFTSVDWIAHAGGALLGLALGYVIGIRRGADPASM